MKTNEITTNTIFTYKTPISSTGIYKVISIFSDGFFIVPFGATWEELKIIGCNNFQNNNFILFSSPIIEEFKIFKNENNIMDYFK